MKHSPYDRLREISWQRKLTPEEEAQLSEWLAAHAEDQEDWELELRLNRELAGLPNVPVSSNFTTRVLSSAQLEAASNERAAAGESTRGAWWLRWLPKAAVAAVVLVAGLLSYHHIHEAQREEVVQSLATISRLPSVPSPEVLKDFDTIAALSSTPAADEELLKLMQ